MSKIIYNSTNMNNTITKINSCSNTIQNAVNLANSLVIPSDYVNIKYLQSIAGLLSENMDELSKLTNWCSTSDTKYSDTIKKFDEEIKNVDNVVIMKRIGYISRK